MSAPHASDERPFPLAGINVLDLSRDLAGPMCSMMLAEHGANVIEVEHPDGGDETRSWPPFVTDGLSGYFATINRSKQSIAIDLKAAEGKKVIYDLVRHADVVMQSFSPGVAERLGLGYQVLCEINPRIIYYSISGFGETGPYRTRRGYDPILQAISGLMSVTGEKDRGPVKSAVPIADVSTAVHGLASILAALLWRERTNSDHGQYIDMGMLDVMVSMLSVVGTRYLTNGVIPPRQGTRNPQRVPSAAFECADGRYLQVVPNQRQWPRFCAILGHPEWADNPDFATPSGRVAAGDILYPLVEEAMRTKTLAEWQTAFSDQAGIACGPINDLADVFADPQVVSRGMVQTYEYPGYGEVPGLALPFRYSETPCRIMSRPPKLGEHTVEVLESIGRTADEIERLISTGVVRAAEGQEVDR